MKKLTIKTKILIISSLLCSNNLLLSKEIKGNYIELTPKIIGKTIISEPELIRFGLKPDEMGEAYQWNGANVEFTDFDNESDFIEIELENKVIEFNEEPIKEIKSENQEVINENNEMIVEDIREFNKDITKKLENEEIKEKETMEFREINIEKDFSVTPLQEEVKDVKTLFEKVKNK